MDSNQILYTSKYASWVVQKCGEQIEDGGWPNIWHLAHFWFAACPLLKSCAHFSDEQNLKLN